LFCVVLQTLDAEETAAVATHENGRPPRSAAQSKKRNRGSRRGRSRYL